jgi:molybdopterin converting factor small subunit
MSLTRPSKPGPAEAVQAPQAPAKAPAEAGDAGPEALPPELRARLAPGTALESPEQCRAALVGLGLCDAARPAVTLELYGGLRLKAGARALPLHAATVGEALAVLRAVSPKAARLMPAADELGQHYRFSLNGRTVSADPAQALAPGDRLIVFSASVGG